MSSAQNQFHQSPKPTSSSDSHVQSDTQADPALESLPLAETAMDQYSDSTSSTMSSASSTASEDMSSTAPTQTNSDSDSTSENSADTASTSIRQQPIPPASEPMQYRAIGLIRGKYVPSEEQFTRGVLQAEDGTAIQAVLLGRVMSLVKKHLDLEQSHLWVVYPRTREREYDLHVQIVGVWEPENLNKLDSQADEEGVSSEETAPEESETVSPIPSSEIDDNYFSIRGEVIYYSPEEEKVLVKIQQSPRRDSDKGKTFKVVLKGTLEGRTVGYFWDLNVQREENLLVIRDGSTIALIPPKKKKPFKGDRRRPSNGKFGNKRRDPSKESINRGDKPGSAPPVRREPLSRPVKRPKNTDE